MRAQRDRELMPFICHIFWQHKRRYGARRIAVAMQAQGRPGGVDRVVKLLKSSFMNVDFLREIWT